MPSRLRILFVAPYPASPATFGAQRRIEGLMRALARRHEVSFAGLIPPHFDPEQADRSMRTYCKDVALVPWPEAEGLAKRVAQIRSLVSTESYEERFMNPVQLRLEIERMLARQPFDLVSIESPFLATTVRGLSPAIMIDAHNVESDLARQYGAMSKGVLRRLHHAANWRKLRREEVRAWRAVDGVAFTSPDDEVRASTMLPGIHSSVLPNGVDVQQFYPQPKHAEPGARTVVFFGTMNYFPNVDAVRWMLREIWPALSRRMPDARLKIIGSHPPPDVLAASSPQVEVTGLVDDLQAHVAQGSAVIVPLRIGGGTRLKILESLAMAKAVVSTQLGAEGIAAKPDQDILIADDPAKIVQALEYVLTDEEGAAELGRNGRAVVEREYSWDAIGDRMESFALRLVQTREAARVPATAPHPAVGGYR